MKWFRRIALALLVLSGLFLAIGMLQPSGFKVQRTAEMAAAPDRSYPLIADPREWKRWAVWNRRDPARSGDDHAVLRLSERHRGALASVARRPERAARRLPLLRRA